MIRPLSAQCAVFPTHVNDHQPHESHISTSFNATHKQDFEMIVQPQFQKSWGAL